MIKPVSFLCDATIERIVRPHLQLLAPGARVHSGTDLRKAGLDPETATDLLIRLEDELGIRIPDDLVTDQSLSSLAEIRNLVEERLFVRAS